MIEDFFAGSACGRTGFIGAGAGQRQAEFSNEFLSDFAFGPAEGDPAGVGRHFERETVGGLDNDGERAGPAGFCEAEEIVGEFSRDFHGLVHGIDEDGESAGFGANFDAEDGIYRGEIDGVGGKGVEGVRRNSDNGAALDPLGGVADGAQVSVAGV